MNSIWNRIKAKINYVFNPKKEEEEKTYLDELLNNLKESLINNRTLKFQIKSAKRNGFVVKVGGMFAFISYNYMPWEYKSIQNWRGVSKHLINQVFYCKIHSIDENTIPIKILINAENHRFQKKTLTENERYKGIVNHKSKYGLFVDIGYHYNWDFGSFVGLIYKSTYLNDDKLLSAVVGDIVESHYFGVKKNGEIILGNKYFQKEWLTGELENYVGTNRMAMVMTDETGKRGYFIDGKFRTVIHLNKERFPNRNKLKKDLNNLKLYSEFECKILRISKSDNFVSEPVGI
jgi:ribosomal protein S1